MVVRFGVVGFSRGYKAFRISGFESLLWQLIAKSPGQATSSPGFKSLCKRTQLLGCARGNGSNTGH